MNIVHDLRKRGYRVGIQHYRTIMGRDGSMRTELVNKESKPHLGGVIYPRGGQTVVKVDTPEGVQLSSVATCNSKDNYNKRLGVKICLGRLGVI